MIVSNLKKSFNGKLVVDLPYLEIEKGSVYVLWGQNGHGKSTFMRLLAGIMPADEGSIQNPMSISYQPQTPYIFRYSCLGNVLLGSKGKDTAKAKELLSCFGLAEKLHTSAHALSGGQQQCMALARSLLTDGDLLLLDEPFSAIDAIRNDDIARFTLDYCSKSSRALLIVVHKPEHLGIFGHNRLLFSQSGLITVEKAS